MFSFRDFILLLEDQGTLNRIKKKWANVHLHNVDDLGMSAHLSNEFKNEYDNWKDFRFDPVKLAAHQQTRYNHHVVEKIAQADRTHTKKYTDYLVNQYRKKHIRSEDLGWAADTLDSFERHKHLLPQKDINQYKRLHDLRDALRPYQEGAKGSNAEDWDRIKKEGTEEIFNNGKGLKVVKLKTKEASCALYGDKTEWCTAFKEDKHNQFDYYNKQGPLYVVHTPPGPMERGERMYQLHFPSNSAMNEKDSSIAVDGLVSDHPELKQIKEFKKHAQTHPEMGLHFLEPHEKRKILTKWATGTKKQKEMAIKHGDAEAHRLLAKDPNPDYRYQIAANTFDESVLESLIGDHRPHVRMKAQYRMEIAFNKHVHPLEHWSPSINNGSEEQLKALSRTLREHGQYAADGRHGLGFVSRANHQTIRTDSEWHEKKMNELDRMFEQHFPEVAKKHGLRTTSETVLIHSLRSGGKK